ncbi:MAG: hypothetical protein ACOC92_02110 [bacterium]
MSSHRHLSHKLILANRRGQISDRDFIRVLLHRIKDSCATCRAEASRADEMDVALESYRQPVARALDVEDALQRAAEEAQTAPDLLEALRPLSSEQRLLRIRNSPARFANPALGEEILAEARACLPDDPGGSLAWARSLEAVAQAYPTPCHGHQVLAIAYRGNAYRALGDLGQAQLFLTRARNTQRRHLVADADVHAELHSFFGSLYTDLRQFDDAAGELEQAAELFRELRDELRLARVLMKIGNLHVLAGDLPAALRVDHQALYLLSPEHHRPLYLSARLNYAFHLQEAGRPLEARDQVEYERLAFLEEADAHTRIRYDWLNARLAADLTDPADAERQFLILLDHFVAQAHGFNAALVCLELAELYYAEEQFHEVCNVAGHALELFRAYETHPGAQAALQLVRDAALARTLTTKALRRAASFLQEAQADRTARFRVY